MSVKREKGMEEEENGRKPSSCAKRTAIPICDQHSESYLRLGLRKSSPLSADELKDARGSRGHSLRSKSASTDPMMRRDCSPSCRY